MIVHMGFFIFINGIRQELLILAFSDLFWIIHYLLESRRSI